MCAVQVLWRFSYSEEHLSPANMNAWIFFFFNWSILALQFCVNPCCESAICIRISGASQVAQWVNNPPAVKETQETWARSLGWEDPLEEGMATHSRILAWRIPWIEEPGGVTVHGVINS